MLILRVHDVICPISPLFYFFLRTVFSVCPYLAKKEISVSEMSVYKAGISWENLIRFES